MLYLLKYFKNLIYHHIFFLYYNQPGYITYSKIVAICFLTDLNYEKAVRFLNP